MESSESAGEPLLCITPNNVDAPFEDERGVVLCLHGSGDRCRPRRASGFAGDRAVGRDREDLAYLGGLRAPLGDRDDARFDYVQTVEDAADLGLRARDVRCAAGAGVVLAQGDVGLAVVGAVPIDQVAARRRSEERRVGKECRL